MTMNDEPRPPLLRALLVEESAADLARRQAEERAPAATAARRVFGFTEGVQQLAAEPPAPVLHQSDVVARRRAEDAQAAAEAAARQAAKAAHDAQFITVDQLVDCMRRSGVSRHAGMIAFEVLRENETPLFCRWAVWRDWKDGRDARDWHPDDARWTPLPPCPVVCLSRLDWGQTYTHINSMGCITTPDPLLSALAVYGFDAELLPRMGMGNGGRFNADALAIRREDAARLFDLAEPTSTAPDHLEDAREMVTAPTSASPAARPEAVAVPAGAPETPDSASAPTVAPPEAVPDGKPEAAEARQDRRLLELRSMGADFVPHGEGWRVTGKRGALAALVKREAGRPMGTKDGVRKDLQRAVQREMERNGRLSR